MQVGIDLGGTKIEAAVLDIHGGFRFRKRTPTPQGNYPATLEVIGHLIAEAESELNTSCTSVGIGHPGSMNPQTGEIRNANSTCLNGKTLEADLLARLNRPVKLANDADCLTLSEAMDGVAREFTTVFGVILGTGVGGGWVVHRKLIRGPNGLAGEWGHNPLPAASSDERHAPRCYCGKSGCIEAWLSGPGLLADYQRSAIGSTGHPILTDARDLVIAAAQGDLMALAALERHTQRLARALATIINAFDPDAIVLGGGVAQRPGLIDRLYAILPAHVFLPPGTELQTRILLPQFGDSSGVRGAARL